MNQINTDGTAGQGASSVVAEALSEAIRGLLADRLTLTVPEAGLLLGLGRNAAYAAARHGELPTLRLGNRLVVPVPLLLEMIGLDVQEVRLPDVDPVVA